MISNFKNFVFAAVTLIGLSAPAFCQYPRDEFSAWRSTASPDGSTLPIQYRWRKDGNNGCEVIFRNPSSTRSTEVDVKVIHNSGEVASGVVRWDGEQSATMGVAYCWSVSRVTVIEWNGRSMTSATAPPRHKPAQLWAIVPRTGRSASGPVS